MKGVKPSIAALRLRIALRLSRVSKSVAPLPPLVLEKLFFFGGLMAIVYGVWLIYQPAGPIVGGVLGIWLATLISAERQ